jgi:hypothetical protein
MTGSRAVTGVALNLFEMKTSESASSASFSLGGESERSSTRQTNDGQGRTQSVGGKMKGGKPGSRSEKNKVPSARYRQSGRGQVSVGSIPEMAI